jgi:hypothetical protein
MVRISLNFSQYDTDRNAVKRIIRQNLQAPAISATEEATSGNFGQDRMRDALLFSGLRWPAAQVTGHRLAPVLATGFVSDDGEMEVPVIATTGQGQRYEVEAVEGWWRDFAELQVGMEARAISFVRRRGDPAGKLAPDQTIHTGLWSPLLNILQTARLCWEPRDNLEISRFIADDERVALFLKQLPADWTETIEGKMGLTYRGLTPVPVAKTLTAYLVASAISSIRRRVSMRRCQYCSSWFELHRRAAVFCTPSCRAAHFNKRVSPHGLDITRDHPQRERPLASALAGTGRGRKGPPGEAQLRDPEGGQGARRAHGRGARAARRRRPAPTQHR